MSKLTYKREQLASRTGRTRPVDSPPPLRLTLTYFSLLFRRDVRHIVGNVNGGKLAPIWKELGVDRRKYDRLYGHPDWELARELAEKYLSAHMKEKTLGDYVFKHLSPEAQAIWDSLRLWVEHRDAAERIKRILLGHSVKICQELFIHALVCTHYDRSEAMRMTGLTWNRLKNWMQNDLEFAQLVEEIDFHKKNFFESAILDLVKERNPLATIWVNKTVNADRGYSEKIRIEHGVAPDLVDFSDLDLDIETRKKVLDAIRRKRERELAGKPVAQLEAPALDVETVDADD